MTCLSLFDSYHLSPFPNDCRQAVLVVFVVDVTGMQLDVLCLCMTGLHRFSLCSGFVGAESSITDVSLLGAFILPGKLFPSVLFLPSNDCFSTEECVARQTFLCSSV